MTDPRGQRLWCHGRGFACWPPLHRSAGWLRSSVLWRIVGNGIIAVRESSCSVAAEERVKHGQLHALLVSSAPSDHGPVAVGRVKMVSVTREGKTKRETGVGLFNLPHHHQYIYEPFYMMCVCGKDDCTL